jgi:drug/metabolite transporter (DMT)-like permease
MAASTITSMLNLMPIIGVFFSWLLLGEQVTLRKFIGGAIVILGVMLSVRKNKTEAIAPVVENKSAQTQQNAVSEGVSQE